MKYTFEPKCTSVTAECKPNIPLTYHIILWEKKKSKNPQVKKEYPMLFSHPKLNRTIIISKWVGVNETSLYQNSHIGHDKMKR